MINADQFSISIDIHKEDFRINSRISICIDSIIKDVTSINAKRIDLVCDRYPTISIKNVEKEKRAASGTLITRIVGPDQKIEQLAKFLKDGKNKENLI